MGEPFIRETSWFSEGLPSLPEVIADFEEDEIAVPVATEDTGSFDLSGTAPELMDAVKKLTSQYEAKSRKVGICKGDPVEIVVTDTHPVNCPPRRLSPDRREALQLLIDDLLARGAICPSKSAYASPIVMVPKKDDSWRLCIDYREVNKRIQDVAFPLPRIDDFLGHLTGKKFFAALDLVHGYHQLHLAPETKHITAFTTPLGLFEWNVLP
ncbi:hypothetical protein ADUPG1_005885, partial [Aduncisulcus paluster]